MSRFIAACLTPAVLVALAMPALAENETPRGLEPADYHDFHFVSDPQIAPDGEQVAFVAGQVSDDRRSRESAIWMVPADASADPVRFTRGDSDRGPRWSPDGERLAFVSTRNDNPQLHLMSARGGEARAVTEIARGSIRDWAWLPDNRRMLLTLNLDPEVEDPTESEDESDEAEPDVTRFSRQVYKTEAAGLLDEQRLGLWLLDTDSGDLTRLTGDPDWNDHNARVSPDGKRVAFNADRTGSEFDGGFNQDLFVLDIESGEVDQLETPEGRSQGPVFSPDGSELAFRHQDGRYDPVEVHRLVLENGERRRVHDGMDLSASGLHWPEGRSEPLVHADYRGARPLMAVDGETPEIVVGRTASLSAVSFSDDGQAMAYTLEDETRLAEVHLAGADGSGERALSRFNRELLESLRLVELERFAFENDAGFEVDAFMVRPVDFDEDSDWPLVLNIKGGPAGMWGHQWFHEFQMLAAAGYAVVFTNYRGSTGYGHDFQSAVRADDRADYGGPDYRDNMLALDAAVGRYDWIDEDRLYVTGGSHGGFLTNWITTRTDRFRAAVTQRSVSSWVSEAGTQAYPPAAMEAEFGGTLWTDFDAYWDRSPLKYADRVDTPTLIIHSDNDHITPIGQGHEWFYALLNNDVEVEMAQFAGEGHGLSRTGTPVNLVKRLELIIEWFDRFEN